MKHVSRTQGSFKVVFLKQHSFLYATWQTSFKSEANGRLVDDLFKEKKASSFTKKFGCCFLNLFKAKDVSGFCSFHFSAQNSRMEGRSIWVQNVSWNPQNSVDFQIGLKKKKEQWWRRGLFHMLHFPLWQLLQGQRVMEGCRRTMGGSEPSHPVFFMAGSHLFFTFPSFFPGLD